MRGRFFGLEQHNPQVNRRVASAALKDLTTLQRDAVARGFGLIARKASKLVSAYRP
jgi:hypothetical protein